MSRKCISDFFGRNKRCTRLIAQPITWCRAHYQQKGYYKEGWNYARLELILQQLIRIQNQQRNITYTIVPIKGEAERALSFLQDDCDIPQKETTHKRGQHYRAPRWALMRIFARYIGEKQTFNVVLAFLQWAQEHMQAGHLRRIPQVEFLPEFAELFEGNNPKGVGLSAPQTKLLVLSSDDEKKLLIEEEYDSDEDDLPLDEGVASTADYDEGSISDSEYEADGGDSIEDTQSFTKEEQYEQDMLELAKGGSFTPINGKVTASRSKIALEGMKTKTRGKGRASAEAQNESEERRRKKPVIVFTTPNSTPTKSSSKQVSPASSTPGFSTPGSLSSASPSPDAGRLTTDQLTRFQGHIGNLFSVLGEPSLQGVGTGDVQSLRGVVQSLHIKVNDLAAKYGMEKLNLN
jgi:hypothetical protein